MDIKEKIGNRIAALRKEKGLSQEALGFESNVNRTYINDLEHARKNVSIVVLERIIHGLGVTFSEFFKENIDG
ncbi:MAG: helix-turn-helix transcriptional regulator [Leadbetterella sp.]|nr:helix-turn-helix transcriptional regulator [Leadbetterella sp.]